MKLKLTKLIPLAIIGTLGLSTCIALPTSAASCSELDPTSLAWKAAGCEGNEDQLPTLIRNIISAVIGVAGLVAVCFIVYGGYQYMTSSGDSGKTQKAKNTILYAAIGLAVCVLSYAIVNFAIGMWETNASSQQDAEKDD
ncbi:hypothetical protein IKZ77_01195 [Candidatus Saccharibacteria bacterium]|nr:hypothetical protein [Candidatus Saccharibacteria bacterium]